MKKIVIAGFQHETNTFGATKAHYHDFEEADAWPGLLIGDQVIAGTAGINLPLAGFVEAAQRGGDMELVPLVWGSAEPSSYVTDDAFERISTLILDGIREAGDIDGIYLDLHGAMVTESHEDGEGELLSRIRQLVGDDLPVAVSLDLHANVTEKMVAHASSLSIFRTYPHIDMSDTGGRAHRMLCRHLNGEVLYKSFRQGAFLIPLFAQYTGMAPCRDIYAALPASNGAGATMADTALGFPPADIFDTGCSVVAYGATQADADAEADRLLAIIADAEGRFDSALMSPTAAVRKAMTIQSDKPVVLADVQDNPGAGATSDTTGLLSALVTENARGAVLGLIHDAVIAKQAHDAGEGAEITAALGGRSGVPGLGPYHGRFRVEALSDGKFPFTGDMYSGSTAELGPVCVLRVLDTDSEVRVVVSSKRCQCLDQAIFTHIGIQPDQQRIVALKSTVHFRADFEPIADCVLNVEAPGVNYCRMETVPYRNLRSTVRLGPGLKERNL